MERLSDRLLLLFTLAMAIVFITVMLFAPLNMVFVWFDLTFFQYLGLFFLWVASGFLGFGTFLWSEIL